MKDDFLSRYEPEFKISSITPSYPTVELDNDLSAYLVQLMSKYIDARQRDDYQEMDAAIAILINLRKMTSWQIFHSEASLFY